MVENDRLKQKYLCERFHSPIINDMKDMGNDTACTFDGGTMKIPKVLWWGAGSSLFSDRFRLIYIQLVWTS